MTPRTLTAEERAEIAALVRAHFGDQYEEVCRGVDARIKVAQRHREAAERGDWSWKDWSPAYCEVQTP